jgi:hypothetical protein
MTGLRTTRKRRTALAVGAATITGLAIVGGAAAADAASTGAPKPAAPATAPTLVVPDTTDGATDGAALTLVAVPGAPDMSRVEGASTVHSHPSKPPVVRSTVHSHPLKPPVVRSTVQSHPIKPTGGGLTQ